MMKRLFVIAFLTALALPAQSVSVLLPTNWILHPVRAFRSVPADKKFMFVTDTVLQAVNLGDYASTYRAFTGPNAGRYCENNQLLVSAPCVIDFPRFTGIKIGVAALGIAEWVPVWLGAGGNYVVAASIVNGGLDIPLALAVANNIVQLNKK